MGSQPPYSLHNGIIRYKNRVWLGNNSELHNKVVIALHSSALRGHSGFLLHIVALSSFSIGHI
jgi:hypothetical protein